MLINYPHFIPIFEKKSIKRVSNNESYYYSPWKCNLQTQNIGHHWWKST